MTTVLGPRAINAFLQRVGRANHSVGGVPKGRIFPLSRFVDGEHHSARFESRQYDLVLASNFCRFESPKRNQELFAKAYSALKPGGYFIVNDFVPNEERTEPTFALRFSVYTWTHTPEGECWTLGQYAEWMKAAGFDEIETHGDIPGTLPGTTLILARRQA